MSIQVVQTLPHRIRSDIIAELERTIELVKAGEIVSVIMIKNGRNKWSQYCSGTVDYPRAIGQLEIIKQDWIDEYRKHEDERAR